MHATDAREVTPFVPSMFLHNSHDPFRPPDRRSLRCRYLLEHGRRPSATEDDDATKDAWPYFRALGLCRDDADRERLAQCYPEVAEAHRFATTAELLRRAELEARLLGGEADDAIARKMALSPGGVAGYHDLYYSVRPFLNADIYITNVVLGPKIHYGLKSEDHELLLKMFGYGLAGPGVDAYLDYLRDPPVVPASLDRLDLPALQTLGDRLCIRVLVLTLTTPAADASPATWLRLWNQFAAASHGPGEGGEAGVVDPVCPALDVVACLATDTPASVTAVADEPAAAVGGHPAGANRGVQEVRGVLGRDREVVSA
jgi:hypothetical protein